MMTSKDLTPDPSFPFPCSPTLSVVPVSDVCRTYSHQNRAAFNDRDLPENGNHRHNQNQVGHSGCHENAHESRLSPSRRTSPRFCDTQEQLPNRNEFIEVLWVLDTVEGSPTLWCPSEVVYVRKLQGQGHDHIGIGVLVYPESTDWDETVSQVQFLKGNLIRCTDLGNCEGLVVSEENPSLAWRRRSPIDSTPLRYEERDESDEDWLVAEAASNRGLTSRIWDSERWEKEVSRLRSGHASLLVEVTKLKRELGFQADRISCLPKNGPGFSVCMSVDCVFSRIRHKLAMKMQMPLRHNRALATSGLNNTAGGVMCLSVRVRVDCSLDQFENIARHLKLTDKDGSVLFVPRFCYTQLPSLNSEEFRIYFSTFAHFCHALGIDSYSDRLEMARRCGSSPHGDLVRLLGTYSYTKNNPNNAVRFFLGTSCGVTDGNIDVIASGGTSSKLCTVLSRPNGKWDSVDSRFFSKMELEKVSLPSLKGQVSEMGAFALIWRRSLEAGNRTWSKDLRNEGSVQGVLEVRMPCIQVCGRLLCIEFAGLATDEEWAGVL